MKKSLLIAIPFISSVAILAGCSSAENEAESSGNEEVNLEFMSIKGENRETYRRLIEKFEEQNPKINIQLTTPPEAETQIRVDLTKNNVPDIIGFNGNPTFGEIAEADVLYDLSETDLLNNVDTNYIDMLDRLAGPDQDGVYGLPYAANANVAIYNKEKLNELDLDVPETWPELIEALEVAQNAGEIPVQFTLLDPWTALPAWNAITANLVDENFGEMKDEGETTFEETHGTSAEKMTQLLEYGSDDNFGKGYDDGNREFAAGNGVFYFQINSAVPEILRINPDMQLGVFPLPVTEDSEDTDLVSGVDVALSISDDSEHKEEALTFLEFMMSEEVIKQYINEQETFSTVKGITQDSDIYDELIPFFENDRIVSFQDHYYPIGLSSENIIQSYLINQNEEAFFNELDEEWDKIQNRQNR